MNEMISSVFLSQKAAQGRNGDPNLRVKLGCSWVLGSWAGEVRLGMGRVVELSLFTLELSDVALWGSKSCWDSAPCSRSTCLGISAGACRVEAHQFLLYYAQKSEER